MRLKQSKIFQSKKTRLTKISAIKGTGKPLYVSIATGLMLGYKRTQRGSKWYAKINGKLNGAVYYAASLLGIKEYYSLSGASAIMALAIGTPKVRAVNKIVGPGSKWVALAKKMVFLEGLCSIESANMGPSEILCLADKSTSPEIIASSMLAQSEHDSEAMAILLTKDKELIKKARTSITNQLHNLPRKKIASQSLKKNGALIYSGNRDSALNYYNKNDSSTFKDSYIKGKVIDVDLSEGLTKINLGKENITVFSSTLHLGQKVIVKIKSTDIIISQVIPDKISSLNYIQTKIDDVIHQKGLICLILNFEKNIIKAHLTKKSFTKLKINKGSSCFAIIKALNINDVINIKIV